MHSSTYRRQLKKFEAEQELNQRINDGIKNDENLRDGFTVGDRIIAEQQEARDLFRAFLAEEM